MSDENFNKNHPDQTNLPEPMVEISRVEALAFQGGQKGGEEYLRSIWMKVLFWTGSVFGYVSLIITVIVNIIRD